MVLRLLRSRLRRLWAPWNRQSSEPAAYDVFISYRRASDTVLASALRNGLHAFARPWYQLRSLRVFRDETSLSASPEMWPSIERALTASRFLVLLTSPETTESKWVTQEINHWLTRDPKGRNLLLVLTAGKLNWNDEAHDFDAQASTALPIALRGVFDHEPSYIDLSWARGEDQLNLRNTRFRSQLAQLAATIHNRPLDEMEGDDVRQHRRTIRIVRATVATLVILALITSSAAVVAFQQRQMALEQLAVANSRQLAATAELRGKSDLQTAMLLSVAAFKISDTAEARANLIQQLQRNQHIERFLTGPGRAVDNLALSRDGRTLAATGRRDSQVLLWDLSRPETRPRALQGAQEALSSVFSPDGKTLAVKEADKIVLWDPASGTSGATFDGAEAGLPAFSPDGRILAIPGIDKTTHSYPSDKVTLWDIAAHKELGTLVGDTGASCVFSPDGRILLMGRELWDISTRTLLRTLTEGHTRGVWDMAFSPDGKIIATGGHDAKLVLWNAAKGTPLATWDHPGDVNAVAFSPDGRILAAGDHSARITLYDVTKRTRLDSLTGGHTSGVLDLAFSPEGHKLVSSGNDGRLIVWSIAPQNPLMLTTVPGEGKNYPGSPAFSPDGRVLAIPTEAGVLLWDIPRRARLAVLPGSGSHPAFSPDGHLLATVAETNILLWDVPRRAKLATLAGVAPPDPASTGAVFSPDGRLLAAAGAEHPVILWDVAGRSRIATLTSEESKEGVFGLAFSPDGRSLATGSYGHGKIFLWDIKKQTQLSAFPSESGDPVYKLSFSPKGDVLAWNALEGANTAIGGDFSVVLWDLAANARRTTFTVHTGLGKAVAFSPDGRMLASDGAGVSLWSIAQGERVATLTVPRESNLAYPRGPVFSHDGRLLATTSSDNRIALWDVDAGSWVRHLCAIAGRDMTPAEWKSVLPDQPYRLVCGR